MKTKTKTLGFFVSDISKTWGVAEQFAGSKGRVANMLDVVNLRVNAPLNEDNLPRIWRDYITTTSAEFLGKSAKGELILIVAHGSHPLSDRQRALKAYTKRDPARPNFEGVRVSRMEFLDLESGRYGPVSIVPLNEVTARYKYPFIEHLRLEKALQEPLVFARLGPKAGEYLKMQDDFSRRMQKHADHPPHDPYIIKIDDCSNASYSWTEELGSLENEALGHLLVVTQLTPTHLSGYDVHTTQWVTEIGLHDKSDGCRMLGIQDPKTPDPYTKTASTDQLDFRLVPCKAKPVPMRLLTRRQDQWFSCVLKEGARMDSSTPEHPVRSLQKGKSDSFLTTIGGYYGFVKYDIKEVEAIAPKGANAYVLDDASIEGQNHHRLKVTFYTADFDLTQRAMTPSEIEDNPKLFLELANA